MKCASNENGITERKRETQVNKEYTREEEKRITRKKQKQNASTNTIFVLCVVKAYALFWRRNGITVLCVARTYMSNKHFS